MRDLKIVYKEIKKISKRSRLSQTDIIYPEELWNVAITRTVKLFENHERYMKLKRTEASMETEDEKIHSSHPSYQKPIQ